MEPWYVSAPGVSIIFYLTFNRGTCPLTSLENYFRKRLNLPTIRGFIGHHILKHVYKKRNKQRETDF